ncbi:MAG TPA: hypothetical protein VKT29_08950 [Terriglobales bacterium]|nr:hypothetical protein [Terriglobales bacterium]
MPAPDNTVQEVRASVLHYLRLYEQGSLTLGDLAAELSVLAPAYDEAMGGIADNFGRLLEAAYRYRTQSAADARAPYEELERVLTDFRRSEAAWE